MSWSVYWTWKKRKPVPSKKVGARKMMAWKKWYIRLGWTVKGNANLGYIAFAPGYDWLEDTRRAKADIAPETVHSCGMREDVAPG